MSGEIMQFPRTVDEFMEQYKVVDTEHIYSNGTEYVPIFRMKQWFEAMGLRAEAIEIPIYDIEEIHHGCTVQVLTSSVTGERSVGWWKEELGGD